jgi:hypothetical protein
LAEEWYIDHGYRTDIGDGTDSVYFQTIQPENLTFERNFRKPHAIYYEVSFGATDIRGRQAVTHNFIGPYRTLWRLRRGNQTILRGMHTQVQANSEEEHVKVAGAGWVHDLELQIFPFNPSDPNAFVVNTPRIPGIAWGVPDPPGVDHATVVKTLLDNAYGLAYTLPLRYTLPATGNVTEIRIDLGDSESIYSKIDGLASSDPGFDYAIANDLEFLIWSPHRYGDNVAPQVIWAFEPSFPQGPYKVEFSNIGPDATHVLGLGSGTSQRKGWSIGYPPGQAEFGRIVKVADFGNIPGPLNLYARTQSVLSLGLQPIHEIVVTVVPETIPLFWDLFKEGEAVWVNHDLEFHHIDSAQQIVTMACSVTNEGDEEVALHLNQIYDNITSQPGSIED